MMENVYILENNDRNSESITTNLRSYIMMEDLPLKVSMKTESLLALINQLNYINLYNGIFILDLDVCKFLPNCIDFAEYVRNKSIFAQFIFITTNTNISFSIVKHRIEPFDLIDKKLGIEKVFLRIQEDLKIIICQLNSQKLHSFNLFSFMKNKQIYSIPLKSLIYIQTIPSEPGLLELHSMDKKEIFSGTLSSIEKRYPHLFRCQKGILINPYHIKKFQPNKRFIYMDNGDKLEVSTRKVIGLKKYLLN